MGGRGSFSGLSTADGFIMHSMQAPDEIEPDALQENPAPGVPEDVTADYAQMAAPGVGTVTLEDGVNTKTSKREIDVASWIYTTFGGEVIVKKDVNREGILTADYLWNGKLWDLKTVSAEKSADNAVRHGLHQIAQNPGGLILDFRGKRIDVSEVVKIASKRAARRKWKGTVDILIITDDGYTVFRHK